MQRPYSGNEPWLDSQNIKLSKDEFTLFRNPTTRREVHQINWYVHRDADIRNILHGYINLPKLHERINILFRNMEINGPLRKEFDNYTYDKKFDMYHCHAVDGKPTYVVMWEADEERRIINIVDIGPHENFNYKRKHNKEHSIGLAIEARAQDETFNRHAKLGLAKF